MRSQEFARTTGQRVVSADAAAFMQRVYGWMTAGLAITPTNNWNITIDAYQTDVDDAIVMSNTLSGDFIQNLLQNFAAESIKFFSNAIDVRARGLDVTSNYRYYFGQERLLETVLSANFNSNEVLTGVKPNPVLGTGFDIYDEFDITAFEKGTPKSRGLAKVRYTHGPLLVGVGANRYGEQLERTSVEALRAPRPRNE